MSAADAHDGRARDAAARRLAQTEFRSPLLLEAGAGTGKTTTLVGRVLAWAMGPGWEAAELDARAAAAPGASAPSPARIARLVLEGIVAITFTDAAASEMERRIGLGLAQLAAGDLPTGLLEEALPAAPAVRTARARALCDMLDHLRVSTIHSFCLWLITRHPFELGLAPRVTVDSDETRLPEIAREVVEEWLRGVAIRPLEPHEACLAVRGIGPDELHGALVALAAEGVEPAALAADPLAAEQVEALAARLRAAATSLHQLSAPALGGRTGRGGAFKLPDALRQLIDALATASPGRGVEPLAAAAALAFPELDQGLGKLLQKWAHADFTATEAPLLSGVPGLPAHAGELRGLLAHVAALDPELLDAARRALLPMLEQVHQRLRASGVETYQALLLQARALLRDHPDVRTQVRAGMRQLLVDEFQDTDSVQCEIVRLLALDRGAATRPGLFLVGDPKQSIYGWRSADLRAYDRFRDLLEEHGGRVEPLAVNFRSAPALLEEVDRSIQPVMRARHGLQPEYRSLLPSESTARTRPGTTLSSSASPPEDPRIAYWVTWLRDPAGGLDTSPRAHEASHAEAEAIAADLGHRRALAEAAGTPDAFRYEECALLLRSMSDLDVYLAALRDAGVPFAVERDRSYYRRREIIDATALVTVVLDAADQLALVALLRSPMVGVPDAALLPLWAGGLPDRLAALHELDAAALEGLRALLQRVASELPPDLPGLDRIRGWEHNAFAALHSLALLRASFASEPPDLFLERLRQTFQQEVLEAARYLGVYRVANLDRFTRALAQAMDEVGNDPQAILRALRESVARSAQAEEARPPAATRGAVRVMTIHKAKGLEFDHVYLAQIHKEGRAPTQRPTRVHEAEGGPQYVLLGAASLGYDQVKQRGLEVEAAERVRTLYVAMTRARERLVIVGRWPQEVTPERAARGATYIDLLQARRTPPPLVALAALPAPARAGDAAGAAWRVVSDDAPVLAVRSEAATALPSAAELSAASLRLHRCREAAAARMARPSSEPLSHAAHEALRELLREGALPAAPDCPRDAAVGESLRTPAAALRRATTAADPRSEHEQRVAMAVGTMVHRLLEEFPPAVEPQDVARQSTRLPQLAETLLGNDPEACAAAARQAETLLQRIAQGRLAARLRELSPHVLARELPVLMPPAADAPTGGGSPAAIGFRSGAIDLFYRDPQSDELVVADYKTDAVDGPAQLQARAAAYRTQVIAYAHAMQQALDLPQPPRAELWFLAADALVPVDVPRSPDR